MRLLARLLAGSILAALLSLVLLAGPATAGCAEPSADLIDGSDVVFSGVATELVRSGDRDIVTVKVDSAFKGEVRRRVDVVSQTDAEDPITAATGDGVLVFGLLDDGDVTSNGCATLVAPSKAYRQVLSDLGAGTDPIAGYQKADRGIGLSFRQFSAGRAILGVLGLSAGAFFVFRFWRARRRTT